MLWSSTCSVRTDDWISLLLIVGAATAFFGVGLLIFFVRTRVAWATAILLVSCGFLSLASAQNIGWTAANCPYGRTK